MIYDVTTGGILPSDAQNNYRGFMVDGPFPNGFLDVTLNVTLLETPNLPRSQFPSQTPADWGLEVFSNYGLIYFACGSTSTADCGYRLIPGNVFGNPPHPFPIFAFNGTGYLDVGIVATNFSLVGPVSPLLYDVSVVLPDGYSIEGLQPGLMLPNVPEPATYILLLLGFILTIARSRCRDRRNYLA
jgi:hypothetical protein